jgi:hypothetical protein
MTLYAPTITPVPTHVPTDHRMPAALADLASARDDAYTRLVELETAEDDVLSAQWREVAMQKEAARAADAVAKGKDPLSLTGNAITDAETRRVRAIAAHRALFNAVRQADTALTAGWGQYLREHGNALMDAARTELSSTAEAYVSAQRAADAARAMFGRAAGWLATVHEHAADGPSEYSDTRSITERKAMPGQDEVFKVYELLEAVGLDPRNDGATARMVTVKFPDGSLRTFAPDRVAQARNLGAVVVPDPDTDSAA